MALIIIKLTCSGWDSVMVVVNIASTCFWRGCFFFFQAEDGIRDVERSRGLGDVYKRQCDYSGISMHRKMGSCPVLQPP